MDIHVRRKAEQWKTKGTPPLLQYRGHSLNGRSRKRLYPDTLLRTLRLFYKHYHVQHRALPPRDIQTSLPLVLKVTLLVINNKKDRGFGVRMILANILDPAHACYVA